jgi:integrase
MSFKFGDNKVKINGIFGKGGREYTVAKYIPLSTYNKIKSFNKINSSSTLNKKLENRKAHDYRYTFARDFYQKAKEAGYSEKEALAMTSQELGHNRIAMTKYYLSRSKK